MKRKKNNDKPMHVVEFPIIRADGKDASCDLDAVFGKRFYIANHIHNVMVKEAKNRLKRLNEDKEYRHLKKDYANTAELLKKAEETMASDTASKEEKKEAKKQISVLEAKKKTIGSCMTAKQKDHGLTDGSFKSYLKKCRNMYSMHISSQQGQKECERVWQACESVLFSDGEEIHFRKLKDCKTISQTSCANGIKGSLKTGKFEWLGVRFCVQIDLKDEYVYKALYDGTVPYKVSYYEIKRRMFPSGYRYYLTAVLCGPAPKKIEDIERTETSPGAVDPGPSTIAYVSETKAILRRLAPRAEEYERRIRHLQKMLDRLKVMHNPDNYNEDGTVKKGHHEWYFSEHMKRLQRMITALHRKKAAYVKQSHNETANEIIKNCSLLTIEPTDFSAMSRKAKKTERSEKESTVTTKSGEEKTVHKYKRKKRFGHSVGLYAPAEMVSILKTKCRNYDIPYRETDPWTYRASQYDPVTGEYKKSTLNERMKEIGGHTVQRDLLSAYILSRPAPDLKVPDAGSCLEGWDNFLAVHDICIAEMKAAGISFRRCFGF